MVWDGDGRGLGAATCFPWLIWKLKHDFVECASERERERERDEKGTSLALRVDVGMRMYRICLP